MLISYFGYGSLVNRATLASDVVALPGRLEGWRREWRVVGRPAEADGAGRGACALTVRPEPGCAIRGVLLSEATAGLAALDKREARYDRIDGISHQFRPDDGTAGVPEAVFLYRAKAEHYRWGDEDHPILQSYLDCVLAGFHEIWGEAGVDHFLETTDGWHAPILADRHAPIYARAVTLEPDLTGLFDERLAALDLRWVDP
ncbi:gamma-glutamylcyclotransferase [Stappia sp. F7233]|uniref:Gamma-glutamylcyclotransferase n=1 Tax=Stappia albiluteola TaxID=2758565 RepID=A0A839AKF3_9HYPH|nr:gamma-glutamylcyclotransferase family protein [Stappia albiluteola]MBA5779362.1 gamma-glutamylcyclotransferase [Stappia albiluteola]